MSITNFAKLFMKSNLNSIPSKSIRYSEKATKISKKSGIFCHTIWILQSKLQRCSQEFQVECIENTEIRIFEGFGSVVWWKQCALICGWVHFFMLSMVFGLGLFYLLISCLNIVFSNFSCMFLNPDIFFNLNYNCSNLLDLRNLWEQVKKAVCYQKLFCPFTVWINCFSDLKNFANSWPSASNFKRIFSITKTIFSHSRSEQFLK